MELYHHSPIRLHDVYHLFIVDVVALIISGEEQKLGSSSLCNYAVSLFTSKQRCRNAVIIYFYRLFPSVANRCTLFAAFGLHFDLILSHPIYFPLPEVLIPFLDVYLFLPACHLA
jgi:hypothetical protein